MLPASKKQQLQKKKKNQKKKKFFHNSLFIKHVLKSTWNLDPTTFPLTHSAICYASHTVRENTTNTPELTRNCVQIRRYPLVHQFVLEACNLPANVLLRSGLNKQAPLIIAKAIYFTGAAISISDQEFQFSSFFQINICSCRVLEGLYANSQMFVRGRWSIGSQVDYECSCGIHPLYWPFRTAEVDLFNILLVRLVS